MEPFFKNIREYWFIIIFIGMVIISWTTFTTRLESIERRVGELEKIVTSFDQIRIDIAVIKEKLVNIEDKI